MNNGKYRPNGLGPGGLEALSLDLLSECKTCLVNTRLSKQLRQQLESLSRGTRRNIVKIIREGCAPLFIACKRGNVHITEYLIRVCDADVEQKGMFEVTEDNSVHWVTPLWCAAVSGKLSIVKCLIRLGSALNAPSDTGSTPVRSACFMTHLEVVQCLVEHGADIKKANFNGGTCLINSVQSVPLCMYLINKGADVNARDIQDKTALHYAIQEHRLDTTILLLKHGADPFAKSRYGDDALQTACLKGCHQIFDYLKQNVTAYSAERLANAHELIGSTFLDEHNETRVAVLHWRLAHHIRLKDASYILKLPIIQREEYGMAVEFSTIAELDNIELDVDAMRTQSLLICERVLGANHKDTLFRLMFRGAAFADSLRFQRCIDLWRLALEIRVNRYSILYSDTCFTGQALVRLLLDLTDSPHDFNLDDVLPANQRDEPKFEDVFTIFMLLTKDIIESRRLLDIRPVYKKQQENFDRVLKCVTHVIYLMLLTMKSTEHLSVVKRNVNRLLREDLRSASTGDTMLHLVVSRLNVIKSGYFMEDTSGRMIFPNLTMVNLLLECGADVNATNESRSTPLHIAATPYNYDTEIVRRLLAAGAHLDQPNKNDHRPITFITINPMNSIPLINYTTLKCLAATVIAKYKIPFRNQVPKELEDVIRLHQP